MDETAFEIDRKDLIEGLGKGLRMIEAFDDDHPRHRRSRPCNAARNPRR